VSRHALAWKALRIGVVLVAAAAVFWWLVATRPVPPQAASDDVGVLVQAIEATPRETTFTLRATGTVEPVRTVRLSAQVSGAIVQIAPGFQEGSSFRKGDLLFRIDPTDYRIELQRVEAELQQLAAEKVQLDREAANLEENRLLAAREVDLATRELERNRRLLANGTATQAEFDKAESGALTARTALQLIKNQLALIPSRRSALDARNEVSLALRAAAESRLAKCDVKAPFDGRALDVYADPGEYVVTGAQLADIWDTSSVEITVRLLPEEFRWLVPSAAVADIERWLSGEPVFRGRVPDWTPRARVVPALAPNANPWEGFVRGLEGRFDRETRTLPVVVEVPRSPDNPTTATRQLPLLPGMFCSVELDGRAVPGIVRIPRSALHGEGAVWVVNGNALRQRVVEVVRVDGDDVLVSAEALAEARNGRRVPLRPGEKIVTSVLSNAAEGLKVRLDTSDPSEQTTATEENPGR
jgi:multidrug resistance efflux pump